MLDTSPSDISGQIMQLIERLYPICRSITGEGVRETLDVIGEYLELEVYEVASGTRVLDWTVPQEWNIREAFVADSEGRRVIDFRKSNLHVVSYSVPVDRRMTLDELRPHLHALPSQPDLVPYRTSYYEETWGFCLSQNQLAALTDDEYHVVIDSSLEPGSLTYGEFFVPGQLEDEVLISTHTCHPSLADDNLSGIAVSTILAAALAARPQPRRSFRFVYAPGTIGAITWLDRNRSRVNRVKAGLTLTCLGDAQPFTYKRTERGETPVDFAAEYVLGRSRFDHQLIDFFPYGYDERQYNSPGFRVPIGSLMRGRHGQFPEYHTSADNLSFMSHQRLMESYEVLRRIIDVLDQNRTMINLQPFGEPQLGTRGLYDAVGGTDIPDSQLAMLWILNQSDGHTSLLDIAKRSGLSFESVVQTATMLQEEQLLREASDFDELKTR